MITFGVKEISFKVTQLELLGYHGYHIVKNYMIQIVQNYYFLFFFVRHLNSRIMGVAMDPKPRKLEVNVILKFRNLRVTTRSKLVSIGPHCVYLFQRDNTHFQVDGRKKACVFWKGFNRR